MIQAASRRSRVSKITSLVNPPGYRPTVVPQLMMRFVRRSSSSIDAAGGSSRQEQQLSSGGSQNPPDPIPNRPLRAVSHHRGNNNKDFDFEEKKNYTKQQQPQPTRGGAGGGYKSVGQSHTIFGGYDKTASPPPPRQPSSFANDKQGSDFLAQFRLELDKKGDTPLSKQQQQPLHISKEDSKPKAEEAAHPEPLAPPQAQDADEIFKKMKETGLIPNAVAMLDGLCKDGLVQEAMKLFGLMRDKGTIPEVVIYTAVVDGFCKAHKLDDAKRIFRKMQNNGIVPNAFSYTVLIQGLCKGKSLDDALDLCVEMLEAGHSPNLATFTGLVDGFCRDKGLEDAQSMIGTLRNKGFYFDDKAVREHLDKKGPFLPLVWEAILGKKSSQKSF